MTHVTLLNLLTNLTHDLLVTRVRTECEILEDRRMQSPEPGILYCAQLHHKYVHGCHGHECYIYTTNLLRLSFTITRRGVM